MSRRPGCLLLLLVLLIALALGGREYARRHPQDVPWTELSLTDPVGAFTKRKIAALADAPAQCRALLADAGAGDSPAPNVRAGPDCGYADGVRIDGDGRGLAYRPDAPVASCPVAAALRLWERDIVQPAARRHLGSPVAAIVHSGTYSCRRIYGRPEGRFSAHATADAIDIAAFRLEDGRTIALLSGWDAPQSAAFLRAVRDGACGLFTTVLSPDYNAAHRDHLHFEQGTGGALSGGPCR